MRVSIDTCDSFHSHVTKKEYKLNFAFNCHSSNVVNLFDCGVCGFQARSQGGHGGSAPQLKNFARPCPPTKYMLFVQKENSKHLT